LQDVETHGIDDTLPRLEASLVDAVTRGEAIDAHALLFLLRRYRLTFRDDVAAAVGQALAVAVDAYAHDTSLLAQSAWLTVFVEASALSDDERVRRAVADLVAALRAGWRSPSIEEASAAVGACLEAAGVATDPTLAADAIDRLEQVIGGAYRPGADLGGSADQVRAASALLVAYTLSGRLPYAMLAEELIQRARADVAGDFVVSCEAARVLCRLAVLHDDADYRAAAVVMPDADYRREAARLLTSQAAEARRRGAAGAIYGVAAVELESRVPSI
jgi:uncharacterized protein YyaL (SSP411 family)